MWAYTAGSTNATRRFESLLSDPQVHARGHRADAAADANPIRGTEERYHGKRVAVACGTAAPVGTIGSARTIEAVLTGGDAAKSRPRLLRVELVIGTIAGSACFIIILYTCMKLLRAFGDKPDPE